MNDALMKMMKMKKASKMSDQEKNAKMSVLENLRDAMENEMGDKLKNGSMKKVTVASDDAEGLEAGLDKAKELVEAKEDASPMEAEEESMEHESEDKHPSEMSPEEIQAKIDELMKYKDKMKKDIGI